MNSQFHRGQLGPLFTITEEELTRPARRREDRDVLVLRVEIEAQRREVARLMNVVGESPQPPPRDVAVSKGDVTLDDRVLLSARELRKALGVSGATLYRWVKDGSFPPQLRIGSLVRWQRQDVDAWIRARMEDRARHDVERSGPEVTKKVRGGRSRWGSTASPPIVRELSAPAWEPRPTPLRGTGHRPPRGVPEPVARDHPDYVVPRYRLADAANYVGLKWHQQWDLIRIPHGRTRAMHYCFAQADLDAFKATVGPLKKGRKR